MKLHQYPQERLASSNESNLLRTSPTGAGRLGTLVYGRDFVVINHAFFSLEVSGHAAVFFSPITMYPRGIVKRLQTVSLEPGVLILHALAGCRGSLLREHAGEDTSPVTTYPVGIGAASTSLPFHIRK